jgi:hypothetical protein
MVLREGVDAHLRVDEVVERHRSTHPMHNIWALHHRDLHCQGGPHGCPGAREGEQEALHLERAERTDLELAELRPAERATGLGSIAAEDRKDEHVTLLVLCPQVDMVPHWVCEVDGLGAEAPRLLPVLVVDLADAAFAKKCTLEQHRICITQALGPDDLDLELLRRHDVVGCA